MPQDLVVNDRLRVTYASRGQNQNGLNVVHYKVFEKGTGPISDLDIAIALEALAKPVYRDVLCVAATFYGVRVQKLTGGPWAPQVKLSTDANGFVDGDMLPTQVAALVSLKTDLATRSGRGRKYIPFLSKDSFLDEGVWSNPHIANLQALAAELFGRVTMVIGGTTVKIDAEITSPGGASGKTVTSRIVRAFPATMRSRSMARGNDAVPF